MVLFLIWIATKSNLPACGTTGITYTGECLERASALHTWSGPLALVFLVLALFEVLRGRGTKTKT